MKSRIFLFFTIVSVAGMLAMSGCHRDDDEQNGGNDRNNRTTGTLNGHDWVDFGLPSGTKWATCNVGANSPKEYGTKFAWGETTAKNNYEWSNYLYCTGGYVTKYCGDPECGYNGFVDNIYILEPSDDAATVNWGAGWRMPTKEEIIELLYYCDNYWSVGELGTGEHIGLGNIGIFLPGGHNSHYWSSSLAEGSCGAYSLYFDAADNVFVEFMLGDRSDGFYVRPVCNQ